jgi:hypothetical protein
VRSPALADETHQLDSKENPRRAGYFFFFATFFFATFFLAGFFATFFFAVFFFMSLLLDLIIHIWCACQAPTPRAMSIVEFTRHES